MSRGAKQLIYGVFYLLILFLVADGLYSLAFRPAPSCFDKIQNQSETGVDCGGPCISCEIRNLQPLRSSGPVQVFKTSGGRAILLTDVVNSNDSFAAQSFTYTFILYGEGDKILGNLVLTASVAPSQTKYLYYLAESPVPADSIQRVEVTFSNPMWQPAREYLTPQLSYANVLTRVEDNAVKVSGTLQNQNALTVSSVTIIAILYDKFGEALFASQTALSDLKGLEGRPFTVQFPKDPNIVKNIDSTATQVFVSGE